MHRPKELARPALFTVMCVGAACLALSCRDSTSAEQQSDADELSVPSENRVLARGGRRAVQARAVVRGPGGIEGVVTFRQLPCPGCPTPGLDAPPTDPRFANFPEPTVEVIARISGPPAALTPGAHGIHVHENGVCTEADAFTSAGGHFDPGPFGNSTPVDANHPFHMGDLPNLIVNARGVGVMRHVTSRITLSPGPLTVFDANGSTVIVHLNPDRGIPGVTGAAGGGRIACGVIEQVSGF
jgi:Cu/Zn superoxide dismutase